MPLRFFRRLRIAKGLTLNLSKRGASLSAGRRGAHLTFGRRGTRATTGVPGTGVSYTSRLGCLLPAALVLAALLAACAPTGDGPIAGAAGARVSNAPAPPSSSRPSAAVTLAPPSASVPVVALTLAPLVTPSLASAVPPIQVSTLPPVPSDPTVAT